MCLMRAYSADSSPRVLGSSTSARLVRGSACVQIAERVEDHRIDKEAGDEDAQHGAQLGRAHVVAEDAAQGHDAQEPG